MADLVQIKNSNINSNNWVNLGAVSFTPKYGKRVKINPIDGQFSGASYQIAKGDIVGIENPKFTIKGVINVHNFSTLTQIWGTAPASNNSTSEDGISMANYVTLGYLIALSKDMTGTTYLKISFGNPSSQTTWKTYNLSTDEIPIEIDDINFIPEVEGMHFINYTIECHEVRL